MLLDILGILIAFASTMLLFSLIVTSTGHFIQGAVEKRYQVLADQLQQLCAQLGDKLPHTASQLREVITEVLDEHTLDGRLVKKLAYVSKEEIKAKVLKKSAALEMDVVTEELATFDELFPKVEVVMLQKFKQWMNAVSITLALLLSVAFHLNSFDIWRNISIDPKLREAYTALGQSQLHTVPKNSTGEDQEIDEQGNGIPVLPESFKQQRQTVEASMALYDFHLFQKTETSYWVSGQPRRSLENLVGILLSTLLISLGAPFWFDALKNLFKLRDKLFSKSS